MAGNNGGPWGGGGNNGGDDDRGGGDKQPGQDGPQIPELEEIVKKGQEQLRVLMGGRRGGGNGAGGQGDGPVGPMLNKSTVGLGLLAAAAVWAFSSFYTVKPEEQSVELFLGKYYDTGKPGLNFAPWPVITKKVIPFTTHRKFKIGAGSEAGLMQTGDGNIVDIDFQVTWRVANAKDFLFTLRDPDLTIRAVAESAVREVIAQSELAHILSKDRGAIIDNSGDLIQSTLDSYKSGIRVVLVNLDKAEPPSTRFQLEQLDGTIVTTTVKEAFLEVTAAEKTRQKLKNNADGYSNQVLAKARGESAQILEQAEGYKAQVVNEAEGEASRFLAVLEEYQKAPEVTRKRLYLETMEKVLGGVNKVLLDENASGGGQGVIPYLPLNQLQSGGTN